MGKVGKGTSKYYLALAAIWIKFQTEDIEFKRREIWEWKRFIKSSETDIKQFCRKVIHFSVREIVLFRETLGNLGFTILKF